MGATCGGWRVVAMYAFDCCEWSFKLVEVGGPLGVDRYWTMFDRMMAMVWMSWCFARSSCCCWGGPNIYGLGSWWWYYMRFLWLPFWPNIWIPLLCDDLLGMHSLRCSILWIVRSVESQRWYLLYVVSWTFWVKMIMWGVTSNMSRWVWRWLLGGLWLLGLCFGVD